MGHRRRRELREQRGRLQARRVPDEHGRELGAVDDRERVPGNVNSAPDLEGKDELFTTAFEIYQAGYPANEFTGLPVAEELMRMFGEQFQALLDGQQGVDEMLETVQTEWSAEF